MPDANILAALNNDNIKVGKLVHEYLAAQSLKIIPQAPFGDAITDYVEEKDKFGMDTFVSETLRTQVEQMLKMVEDEDVDLEPFMEDIRARQEAAWAAGHRRQSQKNGGLNPKPADWNDEFGLWEDQPGAYEEEEKNGDEEDHDQDDDAASFISATKKKTAARRAPAKKAAAKPKAPTKARTTAKAPTKAPSRGRKKVAEPSDDEDDDVIILDESPAPKAQPTRAAAARGRQTQLNFTQSQAKTFAKELSDDEISDDEDAFEPAVPAKRRK